MSLLTKHSLRKGTLKKAKSKSLDVEYTDHDLPSLRRKRTIAYRRLSKALEIGLSATENASDLTQRELFLSYHQEIKQIAASFEHTHFAILDISDDPEQNDDEIQDRFDEMYFKVLAIHRNLTTGESSQPVNNKHSSNIRLPKITLPSFSGDIKKWPEYIDAYNALIHNSTSLTETEKFHYLISSLSGDALLVVKTFPITHEHYQDAYQALTARYKSKRKLAFTCWRDLLNMEFNSCNAHEFRKSLDAFEENLTILKTVNLPVGQWDFVLVYHILSKLDKTLRRDFEEKYYNTELPSYDQLKEYLHSKCEALVRDSHFTEPTPLTFNKPATSKVIPSLQQKRTNVSHALIVEKEKPQNSTNSRPIVNQQQSSTCSFCGDAHSISSCADFLKKSHEERMQLAAEKNWCFNCLKSSHQLKNCTSIFTCRKCRRKHHTLLHRDNSIEPNNTVSSLVARSLAGLTVLLPTAIVQVKDASGRMQSFRALFDTGSQSNFITESAVNRLNLIRTKSNTRVCGLGEAGAQITGTVTCDIATNEKKVFTLDMHVIPKICGDQPIAKLNISGRSHIESLPLADPGFDIPGPIDILFAADVFVESLLHQTIKGMPNKPSAFNSVFGWLLLGSTRSDSETLSCSSSDTDIEPNSLVQRFWEFDPLPAHSRLTPDEGLCAHKILTDHSRDESGCDLVRILLKDNADPVVHGYRGIVRRRTNAVENRLTRDKILSRKRSDFMSNHIETGHRSLVPTSEIHTRQYYIPHYDLWRPEFRRTPLHVVLDGSVKNVLVHSLNDAELICSKLQRNTYINDIFHKSLWWARPCWLSREHKPWPTYTKSPSASERVAVGESRTLAHAIRRAYLNNRKRHDSLMQIVKHVRVGGRISRSGLEYEHKHPAFLPSDHPLTILIIDYIHRNYCYPGINTTHFLVLQQFWIISAKRTIRSHLAKCIKCYRTHPPPLQPFMSDLPAYRVNQVKPFSVVGVDFSGAFRIKLGPHRGAKIDKAYLCLFICLTTKAVHLEVVSTLSTEGFLAALRRFVGRRGRCSVIHADCDTNFVGDRNVLSTLMQRTANSEKIDVNFNPPSAPHFGGVGEIQIKAAKSHLLRVVGNQVLTFEELTTVFVQIEATLNSRPLCAISSDPNDLSVLTPGHFLTLEPLTAVPDEDFTTTNINRLHRWQLLQAFHQNFWSRWKHEYLNSLIQRAKWTKDSKPLHVGSMVIIKDDTHAPMHWPLGRVVTLHSGADGVVRVATVKTANQNVIQRPLVKLCPLPLED